MLIRALHTVGTGGQMYPPGSEIDAAELDALHLVEVGAAELIEEPTPELAEAFELAADAGLDLEPEPEPEAKPKKKGR